ncbi:hypothetical protein [Zhaonella formicivorans]|uniref:hypothetical protein n=1 Tax=Zhaonella formicivorans TaxID=2528593 RepID=UPI0010E0E72B|nr:hypothetical protein [Zhaonella formicivorans]
MEARLQPNFSRLCNDFLEQDKCPCILAELKRCPVCSHLQGGELCNCDWVGTCVYTHYRFSEVAPLPANPDRKKANIIKAFPLSPGGMLIYAQISQQMLLALNEFSLIQLRHIKPPAVLRVPAAVLEVFDEQSMIELAVFTNDLQCQHLLQTLPEITVEILRDQIVFGLVPLSTVKNSKILVIASGYGCLLTPSIIRMLQSAGNEVTTALCASHPVIQERVKALRSQILPFDSKHLPIKELLSQKYSFICTLAQDTLNKKLTNSLKDLHLNIPIALLNNDLFLNS